MPDLRYLSRQSYESDDDDNDVMPVPHVFSERYKTWSINKQLLVWVATALVLAVLAAGMAYAIPLGFAITALHLTNLVYVAAVTALGVSLLAICFDGLFVKRLAKAQLYRTVLMGVFGLGLCVTAALLHSSSALAGLPSMLLKFSPHVAAAWPAAGQVAALMGIILAYILLMAAISYGMARLAEYFKTHHKDGPAQFCRGVSWGFAIGAAAVPLIFVAKFIAVGHMVSFLASTALGHYGAVVFAVSLPAMLGCVGGLINRWWQGGGDDAVGGYRVASASQNSGGGGYDYDTYSSTDARLKERQLGPAATGQDRGDEESDNNDAQEELDLNRDSSNTVTVPW